VSGSLAIYGSELNKFAVYCAGPGAVNPVAKVGIRTRSIINCSYNDISIKEASVACWQFTTFVSGFTGGNNNIHSCEFRKLRGFSYEKNGIPLQTISESTDNSGGITLCSFYNTMMYARNATACYDLSATDDLFFYVTSCGIGGTAAALELRGKNIASGWKSPARNIHFHSFFPGGAINARAGDGTSPSHNNVIYGLSMEDGNTTIVQETGADLDYHMTRSGSVPEWNRLKVRPIADGAIFRIENAAGVEKFQFDTVAESIGMGIAPASGFFAGANGRGLVVFRNDGKIPEIGLRNQANSGDSVLNLEGRTAGAVSIRGDFNMNGTTGTAYLRTLSPHDLSLWTNNVERMRIKSAGGIVLPSLVTADPHVVGQLWANAGVVTVSAG